MRRVPIKTALTILTLLVFLKAPDALPYFKDYKVLDWETVPKVLDFLPRAPSAAPLEEEQLRLHPDKDAAAFTIHRLNAPGGTLDLFYEALRRTEAGEPGAVTRIVHYGDSPTTADLITGDARKLLQKQFGDAGHGFCLAARPWAWYDHNGIALDSSGWAIEAATQSRTKDGRYGLGGVSFRGGAGALTRVTLKDPAHESIELAFLRQPGGGALSVSANGVEIGRVDTAGGAVESGYRELALPRGAKTIEIRALSPVRWFGFTVSKRGPGVAYDSLGLNGAYISVLARLFDERHWAAELGHRKPNLVIINYGTNESGYASFVEQQFGKELREVIRRVKAAVPEASVLIMSPMDRGRRETGGAIGTMPALSRLVTVQQQVAQETGCAFFNTFAAMGGEGTMGRWYEAEPRLVSADFIHPMPAGAKIVGNLLYQALRDGYNRYKVRRMQQRLAEVSRK